MVSREVNDRYGWCADGKHSFQWRDRLYRIEMQEVRDELEARKLKKGDQ